MRAGKRDSIEGTSGRYWMLVCTRLGGATLVVLLSLSYRALPAAASSPWLAPANDRLTTARIAGVNAHLQSGDIIFATLILVATLVTAWNVRRHLRTGE